VFERDLAKRIDELGAAFQQSRDNCHLREQLNLTNAVGGRPAFRPRSSLPS
jgi:hypothetical protein